MLFYHFFTIREVSPTLVSTTFIRRLKTTSYHFDRLLEITKQDSGTTSYLNNHVNFGCLPPHVWSTTSKGMFLFANNVKHIMHSIESEQIDSVSQLKVLTKNHLWFIPYLHHGPSILRVNMSWRSMNLMNPFLPIKLDNVKESRVTEMIGDSVWISLTSFKSSF